MTRKSGILTLAASGWFILVGCASLPLSPTPEPRLSGRDGRPSVGYVNHRDERHDVRDLMDSAYRAASESDFARGFDPDTTFADRPGSPVRLSPLRADMPMNALSPMRADRDMR